MAGRVLLVDDNAGVRRSFGRALKRADYAVVEVENGQEAMAVLPEGEFDVVVSDVRMPDMGGVELLEAVHREDADLPVILMSGEPDLETAMKAVKFGAIEYLTKPVELSALKESVARALELRKVRQKAKQALEAQSGDRRRAATTRISAESWTGALLAGKYRVGELIGTGGMGAVYEAEREDLAHMKVALKVMLALPRERGDLFARFRREAEAVAAIDHPNIVRVLDFQSNAGEPPFIVTLPATFVVPMPRPGAMAPPSFTRSKRTVAALSVPPVKSKMPRGVAFASTSVRRAPPRSFTRPPIVTLRSTETVPSSG